METTKTRGERCLDLSDSAYEARKALERLLKQSAESRVTGNSYLRIYFQDGAVRSVKFAVEESVFAD